MKKDNKNSLTDNSYMSSFVILCLLLASTVLCRRCHRSAHLASVNPNSDNRPPNRWFDVEYDTIDESQDAIVPN